MPNFIKLRLINLFSVGATWNYALKLRIIKWIMLGTPIYNSEYVLSNYGVWMKENWKDKTFKLCILGYRNKLDQCLKDINEDFVFLDIGANQGVFSLVAAKNKYCKAFHAFEPNPRLTSFLESNFSFNKLNNYMIHNFAISNATKKSFLDVSATHSGNGELTETKTAIEISCVDRNYLDKIPSDNIFFAKIDVEGSEILVLNELFNSLLSTKIKYIFIEIAQRYQSEIAIQSMLMRNGFKEKSRHQSISSYDALFTR